MSIFKEGDKVFCTARGEGVVERTALSGVYPILVKFSEDTKEEYTADGQLYADGYRTLFFEEIPIPESATKRPWEPKPHEVIAVSVTGETNNWAIREFLRKEPGDDGDYCCRANMSRHKSVCWRYARPLSDFMEMNNAI